MDVAEASHSAPEAPRPSTSAERPSSLYLRRRLHNALLMWCGDIMGLGFALLVAVAGVVWWTGRVPPVGEWSAYVVGAWSLGAVLFGLLPTWGLGPIIEMRRISGLLAAIFGSAAVLSVLIGPRPVDAVGLLGAFAVGMVAVPLLRLQTKRSLLSREAWGIPVVIYGAGPTGRRIFDLLREEAGIGYRPVAVFDDATESWTHTRTDASPLPTAPPVLPNVPIAIVSQPDLRTERLQELIEVALSQYQTVLIIPELEETPSLWMRSRDISGVVGLEFPCNLARPYPRFVKRATDLALTIVTAPVWGPLCLALAGLIWLEDREPPLFFQERIGRDGASFYTWKFRTMVPDAEAVLQERLAADPALQAEWKHDFKLRHDPRLTTVGRLLRTFSLDELPQLANVLRGEMSLVGPRPLPAYHAAELPASVQNLRRRVRPGMTGLWQVSGRSNAGTDGMEQWDPYYIRNWSLWLDLVILFRTVRAVLERKGAH